MTVQELRRMRLVGMSLLLMVGLLILLCGCTKEEDPQPKEDPLKAQIQGRWLRDGDIVMKLYNYRFDPPETIHRFDHNNILSYEFIGDSVASTYFDGEIKTTPYTLETREIQSYITLPDGFGNARTTFVLTMGDSTMAWKANTKWNVPYMAPNGQIEKSTNEEILMQWKR